MNAADDACVNLFPIIWVFLLLFTYSSGSISPLSHSQLVGIVAQPVNKANIKVPGLLNTSPTL